MLKKTMAAAQVISKNRTTTAPAIAPARSSAFVDPDDGGLPAGCEMEFTVREVPAKGPELCVARDPEANPAEICSVVTPEPAAFTPTPAT